MMPDTIERLSTCARQLLDAAAEIERLRAVEARAKLVIKEWRQYGGYKEPMIEQLIELEELLALEQ